MNIAQAMELIVRNTCIIAAICVLWLSPAVRAQSGGTWQRVTTGDDFTVEVDASSLRFEPDRIMSARYRTVLAKAERLQSDPKTTYKIRVETIQFKLADGTYRSSDISLLSSGGDVVLASAEPREWRSMRSAAGKWFAALRVLYPFQTWNVITYRLVDMTSRDNSDSLELDKLVGSHVQLTVDFVQVGNKRCSSPRFESRKLTDADLEKLFGVSVKALGFGANPVDVIALKCDTTEWQPNQSLLVQLAPDRMLMLWDGVFLELAYNRPKQFPIPITIQDVREKSVIVTSPD
jgi:hypothetical protein